MDANNLHMLKLVRNELKGKKKEKQNKNKNRKLGYTKTDPKCYPDIFI